MALAGALAQGQEPGKGGPSELELFKELKKLKDEEKKLKDEEKKLRHEEIVKETVKLRNMFGEAKVVIYLNKMGKDAKESEIEGWIWGVEEVLGEKFLKVGDRPTFTTTIALVKGASIIAIKRK
jgi:hypothetical protein